MVEQRSPKPLMRVRFLLLLPFDVNRSDTIISDFFYRKIKDFNIKLRFFYQKGSNRTGLTIIIYYDLHDLP